MDNPGTHTTGTHAPGTYATRRPLHGLRQPPLTVKKYDFSVDGCFREAAVLSRQD